jgi:hypothetical protein
MLASRIFLPDGARAARLSSVAALKAGLNSGSGLQNAGSDCQTMGRASSSISGTVDAQ